MAKGEHDGCGAVGEPEVGNGPLHPSTILILIFHEIS